MNGVEQAKNHRRARRMWEKGLRPWLLVVFGSACIVISVCQTASFLLKFVSKPMVTTTSLQEVNEFHAPWITICPQPGVDFTRLAKSLKDVTKVPKPRLRVDGFTVAKLKEFSAELQAGYQQQALLTELDLLVEGVLMPLRKHSVECSAIFVRNQTDDSYSKECTFAEEFDVNPAHRRKGGKLGLLSSPRVTKTPLGIWETRLQLRRLPRQISSDAAAIVPCSTFKPNVTFSPHLLEELRIGFELLNVSKLYPAENVSYMGFGSMEALEQVPPLVWPTYRIYLRQPYEVPDTYIFDDVMRPERYFDFFAGETVYAQLSVELWKFLSTNENPCSDDMEVIEQHAQCYRECIESHLLAKGACLFPGLRERDAATLDGFVPDVSQGVRRQLCSNASDFAYWAVAFQETDGIATTAACRKACPTSCLRMNYDLQQSMLQTYRNYSSGALNIPSVFRDQRARLSRLILKPRTRLAKLEEQVYSYGISELLSEIGGSWGLFLGASIISVGYCLETLLLMALDALEH